jgi:hypothetical protein
MRVRLTTQVQGTRDGRDWPAAGTEVDLPEAEARALIAGGSATDVSESVDTVLVPPMGIHTPGTTAMPDGTLGTDGPPLVRVPADAAADPDGVRQALKDRAEGNFVHGPGNVAHQHRDGSAMTEKELDKAGKDEQAAQAALASVAAPKVGETKSTPAPAKTADKTADKR